MAKSLSHNKGEQEKKKHQKRQEKEQRKAERKANKDSTSFEDMIAYVDEDGNISSTPPDPTKKKVIKEEDIVLGSRNIDTGEPTPDRHGRVTFFNDAKGYGFIKDEKTQESIFVHSSSLTIQLRENDRVTFETQPGQKGPMAVNVKKI